MMKVIQASTKLATVTEISPIIPQTIHFLKRSMYKLTDIHVIWQLSPNVLVLEWNSMQMKCDIKL